MRFATNFQHVIDGQGALADVYVYPLPEAVTVANNQTKQVGLIDAAGVPAGRVWRAVAGYQERRNSCPPSYRRP